VDRRIRKIDDQRSGESPVSKEPFGDQRASQINDWMIRYEERRAPALGERLNTFPPRANGGNMDNPFFTVGTTVFFPIFAEGALFSIGDAHAVQGKGEISGTGLETPMRTVFRLEVIKTDRPLPEPQYETDELYATTGFGLTIDEAARKATRYMVDHVMEVYGYSEADAFILCSLACDLEIAEVVDKPHMLVAMHLRKDIFADVTGE
ncbi:MAG: acetamidase/formamidase family protein, partial [Pseudomonadota bacterium]